MNNGGTVTGDGTVIKEPSGYYPITPSKPDEPKPEDPTTDPDAEQAKIERIIKGVEATTLKARSSKTAKGIKITWTKSKGYKVDYYVIYRSTKKNSGYGTKPFYTTKSSTKCYYINTKDLKKGTKYYYKVRGVRVIDGQKYYTEYSTKAIRTW